MAFIRHEAIYLMAAFISPGNPNARMCTPQQAVAYIQRLAYYATSSYQHGEGYQRRAMVGYARQGKSSETQKMPLIHFLLTKYLLAGGNR